MTYPVCTKWLECDVILWSYWICKDLLCLVVRRWQERQGCGWFPWLRVGSLRGFRAIQHIRIWNSLFSGCSFSATSASLLSGLRNPSVPQTRKGNWQHASDRRIVLYWGVSGIHEHFLVEENMPTANNTHYSYKVILVVTTLVSWDRHCCYLCLMI